MGSVSRFLVDRPNFQKGSIIERLRVLDDSRVLNWVFIMWATELGSALGIFFMATQSFYEFSLYPTYIYLFILFVIVLYLQQWTNYTRLYKSLTRKWFLPITIVFLLCSYILGSVNFIDYKRLNESVLAKNPYYLLDITKPESSIWTYTRRYSATRQLYVGLPQSNGEENNYQILYEGALELKSNSIDSFVEYWKSRFHESHHPGFRFQLNIDKSTPMKIVNKLKDEIVDSKIFRIGYSVVPQNVAGIAQLKYQRHMIPANLYDYNFIDSLYPDRFDGKEIYNVSHNSIDLIIEDIKYDLISFREEINRLVESDANYIFKLNYDESLEYGKFIELYASIYGSIVDKREEYSEQEYQKKYDWNTDKIKREIRKIYPLNIEDSEYQKEGRTIANMR